MTTCTCGQTQIWYDHLAELLGFLRQSQISSISSFTAEATRSHVHTVCLDSQGQPVVLDMEMPFLTRRLNSQQHLELWKTTLGTFIETLITEAEGILPSSSTWVRTALILNRATQTLTMTVTRLPLSPAGQITDPFTETATIRFDVDRDDFVTVYPF